MTAAHCVEAAAARDGERRRRRRKGRRVEGMLVVMGAHDLSRTAEPYR